MTDEDRARIEEARQAERDQALWYRAHAMVAMEQGDGVAEERLNGLLADEQHHLSRLTARLLELGLVPAPFDPPPRVVAGVDWTAGARLREEGEIARYEALLDQFREDPAMSAILREILDSERQHARSLGGKWMSAVPGGGAPDAA